MNLKLLSTIALFQVFMHPLHLSVTNISYENQHMHFAFKLFTDDLETVIYHKHQKRLYLTENKEAANADSMVTAYLNSHFAITLNEKKYRITDMHFIKKEQEANALWYRYKFPLKKPVNHISIRNSILNDLFFDQTNLIFFTYKNTDKAFKLDREKETQAVSLQP